jgi:uncharacterized beta-barrel protein YwiB (DUF1934 family)
MIMTKEVFITIEGRLLEEEEPVILRVPGTYHFTKGSHYIQYEEKLPESDAITKNIIKITPSQVTLSRKGKQLSRMIFDRKETTQAVYQTAYGSLLFELKTQSILLNEGKDNLELKMEYSLSVNDAHLSDNRITVNVTSKL